MTPPPAASGSATLSAPCLARDLRNKPDPVCPEKLWHSQPCKCTGPVKDTVVEALKGKFMALDQHVKQVGKKRIAFCNLYG